MERYYFEPGQTIFEYGDQSKAAYLILSGEVEVLRQKTDGSVLTIATLGKGEYLGEMGVIDDRPRSATTRAKNDVVCMSINKEEFMDMLLNRPAESIDLLKILFERLRKANAKLEGLETGNAEADD